MTGENVTKIFLGVDVGYNNTKTFYDFGDKNNPYKHIFLSTVKKGKDILNPNTINLGLNNNNFIIGSISGQPTEDLNKTTDNNFKLFLLTAIAKSMPTNSAWVNIFTGVPADFYDKQAESLENFYRKENFAVTLNGVEKKIYINKFRTFPQGSGLFILNQKLFEKGKTIVIDIGGKTIDVNCYNGFEIIKRMTINMGILDVYKIIVSTLQSDPNYSITIDKMEAADVIANKSLTIKGIETDLTKLVETTLSDFISEQLDNLSNNLIEYNNSKRIFVGGGVDIFKSYLPKESVIIDDVYFNAKIFHYLAHRQFDK